VNNQLNWASSVAGTIVINVAAGVGTYFVTRSALSAVAAVAIIEAILTAEIFRRLMLRPRVPGVIKYSATSPVGGDLLDIATSVTSEFIFWGISAKTIIHSDDFRNIMLQKARGRTSFRFLILDPNSPKVALRAAEEGDTAVGWKREIEANIERLTEMRNQYGLNIEIRIFDAWPVFRLIFVDSRTLYFGWYPRASQGLHSPLIVATNTQPSIYDAIRRLFDDAWDAAREPRIVTERREG
jgi:hypothetical protein